MQVLITVLNFRLRFIFLLWSVSANMFDHRGLRFYICTVFYYALMYFLYKYSSKLDYCAQDQDLMPHT